MPKNSVPEWDVIPDNNTDVGGVDIRQPANGSNLGYAVREIMAQIKEWTTSATFTGISTFENVYISSVAPTVRFIETDGATDEKTFRIILSGGDFFFQALTDAGVAADNVMVLRRDTGTTWARVELNVPLVLNTGGTTPMIAFDSDLDTGILQEAENTLSIKAANTVRVVFASTITTINTNTTINGTLTVTG